MKVLHVEEVLSQGGRNGKVESSDGSLNMKMAPARGPGHQEGTNPEQLFSAAYASCFMSALEAAARKSHVELNGATLTARTSLLEETPGDYHLGVELRASIPGVDRSKGERLMHMAHDSCPFSKAVRGNVDVQLTLD